MIRDLLIDDNCLNLYCFGSHIYGTNNKDSDRDHIAIVKVLPDFGSLYDKENVTIHFYTESNFLLLLESNEIQALEISFLPNEYILKETLKFNLIINKNNLRTSISTIVSNSWVKGKKKLIIQGDYDKKLAIKSIFHSLRISDFGRQVASEGAIVDYSSMNWLLIDLYKISENKEGVELWNLIDHKYRKLYNTKCSEFKKLCPLDKNKIVIENDFIIINGHKIVYDKNKLKDTISEILENLNIEYNA